MACMEEFSPDLTETSFDGLFVRSTADGILISICYGPDAAGGVSGNLDR